jgi:MFS family permease
MTLGYLVYAADRTVFSAVLKPLSESLNLSAAQLGLLTASVYIGVFCTVFVAGHLSDRFGRLPIVIIGVSIFTVFTWMIGFSSDFIEAFIFRLISGFGEGIFWPVAMASVAGYFGARKGLGLGVFYVGFDAGGVTGLTLSGLAYSYYGDWRPVFFIAPSIGVIVVISAIFTRGRLESADQKLQGLRLGRDALDLLKRRNVVLLMFFALLATWASFWQTAFLPYYFGNVYKFTVLSASLISSVVLLSGAAGKLVLGRVSDSVRRNRLLPLAATATLASYALFFTTSDPLVAGIGLLIIGFFSAAMFPVIQALMADSCDGKIGTALGLTTSSQSIATIFAPIITTSLFNLGVGRAVALDAMIPIALAIPFALLLKEPRVSKGTPA